MWAYIFFFHGQTRSCTQECDEIKANHEEQLPERFIILWESLSSDGCLMTEITWNYAGQQRTHENRPKVAWRLLWHPTVFTSPICIADSLHSMVVSHLLATLNKQTASAGVTSSLTQPVSCCTYFWLETGGFNYLPAMIPKFFSWSVCWMTAPFHTYSPAQSQLLFQLSVLNGICHLNYPNSLESSPAVPHYKPKSCDVLGTLLLSKPRATEETRSRIGYGSTALPPVSLLSCFFGCLTSNTLFQPIAINRQNKDTKNDPGKGGGHFVSVCSPDKLVMTSPTALEGVLSFTRDLRISFPHVSVTGSTLGEETARSELS